MISNIYYKSTWAKDGTQIGYSNPDHSEPGSNCNEGVLRATQISRTIASTTDAV